MNKLFQQSKLTWIGKAPVENRKAAMLIPQFNEKSRCNFTSRLEYFRETAVKFKNELDVVIIDDGSTDGSLDELIAFKNRYPDNFFLASVSPNANKVGALFITAKSITHDLVILSDFDTDIGRLDKLIQNLDEVKADPTIMGCYFRMLPYEGSGSLFLFQQLEYSLQRSLYKFHNRDRTVPVMPGSGSCFKRSVLISIYLNHSGLRNGEDREATLIGHKMGYKTFYYEDILTLTRPPLTFKSLVVQRIRWNLGYLETIWKEQKYYYTQMAKLTTIGVRAIFDFIDIAFTLFLPIAILVVSITKLSILLPFLLVVYLLGIAYCVNLIALSPKESKEIRHKLFYSVLYFPIVKITLDYCAWLGAILIFVKKIRSYAYERPQ